MGDIDKRKGEASVVYCDSNSNSNTSKNMSDSDALSSDQRMFIYLSSSAANQYNTDSYGGQSSSDEREVRDRLASLQRKRKLKEKAIREATTELGTLADPALVAVGVRTLSKLQEELVDLNDEIEQRTEELKYVPFFFQ